MQIFDQNGWSQCSLFAIHILALLARTWHLHKLAWRTQRSPLSWQKFPRQQTSSTKDGRDIQHMQMPQGKGNWLPDWGCENCHTGSCTCNYLAWTSLCNTETWRWSHGPLHSHKPKLHLSYSVSMFFSNLVSSSTCLGDFEMANEPWYRFEFGWMPCDTVLKRNFRFAQADSLTVNYFSGSLQIPEQNTNIIKPYKTSVTAKDRMVSDQVTYSLRCFHYSSALGLGSSHESSQPFGACCP